MNFDLEITIDGMRELRRRYEIEFFIGKKNNQPAVTFNPDVFDKLSTTAQNEVKEFVKFNKQHILKLLRRRFREEESRKLNEHNSLLTSLSFEHPDDLAYTLKGIGDKFTGTNGEGFPNTLDHIFDQLEQSAKEVLKRNKFSTSLGDVIDIYRDDPILMGRDVTLPVKCAADVIFSIMHVKDMIHEKDIEKSITCMIQLISSAIKAEFYDYQFSGLRNHISKQKGGGKSKKAKGIILFIQEYLETSKAPSPTNLLKKLGKYSENNPWEIEDIYFEYQIFMDSDEKIQHLEIDLTTGKIKRSDIAASTLCGKNYYQTIKKNMH